jgi:CheY-like chemotaxis protein
MSITQSKNLSPKRADSCADVPLPSILVVDDSLDAANSLCLLCAKHGYKTHVAFRWETALQVARAHLPDIIVLDLGMPEMDGVHLARYFREDEQLKDTFLVAVTGFADEMHQEQCKAAGFDSFLSKPVAWANLKDTIDRFWCKQTLQQRS